MRMKLIVSVLAGVLTCGAIEGVVRAIEPKSKLAGASPNIEKLFEESPTTRIKGREIGNQMLVHNIALFSHHPDPESITSAFVGTSRSKVLRPQWFGLEGAANGSGNTYNEITYGALLQAEILRLRFPNIRTVYLEASLLLRRPDRLIVEEDHRKYLPLLESALPLRDGLPGGAEFRKAVETELKGVTTARPKLLILQQRSQLRLSSISPSKGEGSNEQHDAGSILVMSDPYIPQLHPNGERKAIPKPLAVKSEQPPEIKNDNIKVQRLRDIVSWSPWDQLFDVTARWGHAHNIKIVFFQPPVRSDLYQFQKDSGLNLHTADLQRLTKEYKIPFIDLNRPDLNYMHDWSLFSDEDHLETCIGSTLLQAAILEGERRYEASGELLPLVPRKDIEAIYGSQLARCHP